MRQCWIQSMNSVPSWNCWFRKSSSSNKYQSVKHQAINRNAFQEELFQSDNEILELNLDAILQKTNNSTPVNTITMPPSTCTSTRYEIRNIRSTWSGDMRIKMSLFIVKLADKQQLIMVNISTMTWMRTLTWIYKHNIKHIKLDFLMFILQMLRL